MHTLTIGTTGTGKSTINKLIARSLHKDGGKIGVFDPMFDRRWVHDFKTENLGHFFNYFSLCTGWHLFADEAGGVGKFNETLEAMMTKWRHLGHNLNIITQRPTQLAPIVRDQCFTVYIFQCSDKAKAMIAEEWCAPQITKIPLHFEPRKWGEVLIVTRNSKILKARLDFPTGKMVAIPLD